ncbi:hypothetical protein HMPREF1034_1679 [Cutibacterium acnes SK187]|nr:hypothetical protein HMPREF1034_1679 [Cutibacterium acnes SK187]
MPQPFQVFLDEGTDLNLPDLCRAVTRGNVARSSHAPIIACPRQLTTWQAGPMTTSIDGTALVLEGGGMRAAYTSAVIVKMLGLG